MIILTSHRKVLPVEGLPTCATCRKGLLRCQLFVRRGRKGKGGKGGVKAGMFVSQGMVVLVLRSSAALRRRSFSLSVTKSSLSRSRTASEKVVVLILNLWSTTTFSEVALPSDISRRLCLSSTNYKTLINMYMYVPTPRLS